MTTEKCHPKRASRLFASVALLLATMAAPTLSLAAGPGGLALGFGTAISHIVERDQVAGSFAGVSDPISFRSTDNINTRGFALRKDGAY